MKEYLPILQKTSLFKGLSNEEILLSLKCLNGQIKKYDKEMRIFEEGDFLENIGIVLEGEIEIQKGDFAGNKNIISRLFPPDILGVANAYSSFKILPFTIVAKSMTSILWLNNNRLVRTCGKTCYFHTLIIENILQIIASKNLELTNKIDILTKRSIREKVLSFLYAKAQKDMAKRFTIGMSRSQLADYLSVNRSALIRELGKMKKEKIIDFEDNIFWFKMIRK